MSQYYYVLTTESSGLSDIWEESGVFGETTADNILKGKIWNRVIRAHKLSFEALWRVLWPLFETWCDENSKDAKCYSQRPAKRLAEEFFSEDDESKQLAYNSILENLTNIREIFEEFDAEHKDDATFCSYILENLYAASLHSSPIYEGDTRR